jgi:hypothetical protein
MLVISGQKREFQADFVDPSESTLLAFEDTHLPSFGGYASNYGLKSPHALRFYEYTANCGPAGCGG